MFEKCEFSQDPNNQSFSSISLMDFEPTIASKTPKSTKSYRNFVVIVARLFIRVSNSNRNVMTHRFVLIFRSTIALKDPKFFTNNAKVVIGPLGLSKRQIRCLEFIVFQK